jgi:hypothetical protein
MGGNVTDVLYKYTVFSGFEENQTQHNGTRERPQAPDGAARLDTPMDGQERPDQHPVANARPRATGRQEGAIALPHQ